MSATTPTIEDKVCEEIREFWPYWNLGRNSFFRFHRYQYGNVRIEPWIHTKEMAEREELHMMVDPFDSGRMVPAGLYVKLQIFQKSHRGKPEDKPIWETVMSDTPDEFNGHNDVLLNATGNVLIHGLGLGCLLNCLLHKPDVKEIDVVEINPGLAYLLAPRYKEIALHQNTKLNFHWGSCVDIHWPVGKRWNYVWHDIWTTISPSNLRQNDEPEHGISYERLHRMFGNRCDRQGSWGFEEARWMRAVEDEIDDVVHRFATAWNWSGEERRWEMLTDIATPNGTNIDTDTWLTFLQMPGNTAGNQMFKQYQETIKDEITPLEARVMLGDRAVRYATQKTKKPMC